MRANAPVSRLQPGSAAFQGQPRRCPAVCRCPRSQRRSSVNPCNSTLSSMVRTQGDMRVECPDTTAVSSRCLKRQRLCNQGPGCRVGRKRSLAGAKPHAARQRLVRSKACAAPSPPARPTGDADGLDCSDDTSNASTSESAAVSTAKLPRRPSFNFWVDEAVLSSGATQLVMHAMRKVGGHLSGGGPKQRGMEPAASTLGCFNMKKWDMLWTRSKYARQAAPSLRPGQQINLVPGLQHVTGKKKFVETLEQAYGELAWELTPRSFQLPESLQQWREWTAQNGCPPDQLWMLKSGANRGMGLQLATLKDAVADALRPLRHAQFKNFCVAQRYVADPMLILGRKFHLRLWVVVTGHSPLRAYLHRNGLVLFSTAQYDLTSAVAGEGGGVGEGHVTNYAQNENGLVWSLQGLKAHLGEERFQALWLSMAQSAALVVSAGLPRVLQAQDKYRMPRESGFQLLGFDFLLDSSMRPWVLEVNEYPSLKVAHSDTALEEIIREQKTGMVEDMFGLVKHRLAGGLDNPETPRPDLELKQQGNFVPLMPLFPVADPKLVRAIPWSTADRQLHQQLQHANLRH